MCWWVDTRSDGGGGGTDKRTTAENVCDRLLGPLARKAREFIAARVCTPHLESMDCVRVFRPQFFYTVTSFVPLVAMR